MSEHGTTTSGSEDLLRRLRAAWRAGPPPPQLREFIPDNLRDADLLYQIVQCDVFERRRVCALPAWRNQSLPVTIAHYEAIIGTIEPGTPIARLLVRAEIEDAAGRGEDALGEAIDRLDERYPDDVAAALRDLPSDGTGSLVDRGEKTTNNEPVKLPERIGKYRIRRAIASGGMGTVYEAVQDAPRRTVALKVMKHGIASRSALRRFEYESQILARLRHSGIAQVYDAGTHDDGLGAVPYFVMEYIPNAKPITQYARDKKLSTRERLELFATVCEAVYHGHQKGIIHRDLKPSNILVDTSGGVKVIDFGVARATDSDLAVTTLQTDVGQLIGTLQYMSPEQCDADPHGLDTRSDVYALGVVLYEMLCEQLPYDVTKVALYEAARVIREEPPTRPSSFNRTLRGDVETIALKALEKERNRRYRSTADFGADIQRYLSNEPIIGRPPSLMYQIRTFARRNRAVMGGTLATFLVLIAGLVLATTLYLQAEEARADAVAATFEAESRLEEARGLLDAMNAVFDERDSHNDFVLRPLALVMLQVAESVYADDDVRGPHVAATAAEMVSISSSGWPFYTWRDAEDRHTCEPILRAITAYTREHTAAETWHIVATHKVLAHLLRADGRLQEGVSLLCEAADLLELRRNFSGAEELLEYAYKELQRHAQSYSASIIRREYLQLRRQGGRLYDVWHAAEPDAGHDAKAAEWRAKLAVVAEVDDGGEEDVPAEPATPSTD